jgi:hypothetical protein
MMGCMMPGRWPMAYDPHRSEVAPMGHHRARRACVAMGLGLGLLAGTAAPQTESAADIEP